MKVSNSQICDDSKHKITKYDRCELIRILDFVAGQVRGSPKRCLVDGDGEQDFISATVRLNRLGKVLERISYLLFCEARLDLKDGDIYNEIQQEHYDEIKMYLKQAFGDVNHER
jgi:hypothetical protein